MTDEILYKAADLAARCEAAEGEDRDLDGAIDRLFNERPKDGDFDEGERAFWRVNNGWSGLLVRAADGLARGSFCASAYTASLDAAMTLVPEGWHLAEFGEGPNLTPRPHNFTYDGTWFAGLHAIIPRLLHNLKYGSAATPALALCAAALRAREASTLARKDGL